MKPVNINRDVNNLKNDSPSPIKTEIGSFREFEGHSKNRESWSSQVNYDNKSSFNNNNTNSNSMIGNGFQQKTNDFIRMTK